MIKMNLYLDIRILILGLLAVAILNLTLLVVCHFEGAKVVVHLHLLLLHALLTAIQ